jgi:hypothetical protein
MLEEDHPAIRYQSPRSWIKNTDYLDERFSASLEEFSFQRAQLLKRLRQLGLPEWSRGATFTATTNWTEPSVFDYAMRMSDHEQEHVRQIEGVLIGGGPRR